MILINYKLAYKLKSIKITLHTYSPHNPSFSKLVVKLPTQEQRENTSVDYTLDNSGPYHSVFSRVNKLISLYLLHVDIYVPVLNLK